MRYEENLVLSRGLYNETWSKRLKIYYEILKNMKTKIYSISLNLTNIK